MFLCDAIPIKIDIAQSRSPAVYKIQQVRQNSGIFYGTKAYHLGCDQFFLLLINIGLNSKTEDLVHSIIS